MALDRESIERRDFPIARRGYDIEAVDTHLQAVADAVDALRHSLARTRSDTLASSASEQVRAIIEAAEQSATEIEREADLEARQVRQDAREAAERLRDEAGRQAREHVQRAAEAARATLERVRAMEQELGGLLDAVRGGARRVSDDLSLLEASVGALQSVAEPPAAPAAPPSPSDRTASLAGDATSSVSSDDDAEATLPDAPPAAAAAAANAVPAASDPVGGATPTAPPERSAAPVGTAVQERTRRRRRPAERAVGPARLDAAVPDESEPTAETPAATTTDEDGARLIALNLALNGTSRDEAERYLRATYDLDDARGLLDDVYSRIGQ